MTFTDIELAYARAILTIERDLVPKCNSCGVEVNRPNCAADLGGYCEREDQEDTEKFYSVVRYLEDKSGLRSKHGWRQEVSLIDVVDFDDIEKNLIHDLYDLTDKKHTTRSYDSRWSSLCAKRVCYMSVIADKWTVMFTKRGEVLAETMFNSSRADSSME